MIARKQHSQDSPTVLRVIIAFVAVLPATIASVAALIVAIGTSAKVEEVHKATNSMKDALVAAALLAGKAQGVEEEKQRAMVRDIQEGVARAKGVADEKARAGEAKK